MRDGESWPIGVEDDVRWISESTSSGLAITSAVPPVFDAYATVVVPKEQATRNASDHALLEALRGELADGRWWLGYLDTSPAEEIIFRDVPVAKVYTDWSYVLVGAGAQQAATWRTNDAHSSHRGALPELMFPFDRSWLVSTLWDDDWRCVGGSDSLIDKLLDDPRCETHRVALDEEATPPGHRAI
jgi:hypothetical protein